MSKVAEYLQEHILGEVTTNAAILEAMSTDASVLTLTPEMVVYPRVTSDIRKVARFGWQLAEKGHPLAVTVRGSGSDQTGGAIGKGVVIATPAHMNSLLEFDPKQKLVRVQPGLSVKALSDALMLHGMGIPSLPTSTPYSTIGGAVANNASGPLSGGFGSMREWTHQLEIVLSNGDVLQTERLSKRELNKRKGLQTFEGEIYRNLDNLIEDHKDTIQNAIGSDTPDAAGYSAIARVKQPDGSFDLTPLFIGCQGTLGVVSEMILKAEFMSTQGTVAVAAFTSKEAARDALDQLRAYEPTSLDYYDGELFAMAAAHGRKYEFLKSFDGMPEAVVVVGFYDFNERVRHKKLKRATKLFNKLGVTYEGAEGDEATPLEAAREVTFFATTSNGKGVSHPPIFDGAYIPPERLEEFSKALQTLAGKHEVAMPIHYKVLENTVFARPPLQFHKVSDKQKIFKLLDEYAALVVYYGGCLVSQNSEGRIKARFAYASLDDEVKEIYEAVKTIFDPYGILNPGVKQVTEVRQMAAMLQRDYNKVNQVSFTSYM